ncbi:alpha/beta fold hydrolase [Jiangella aurantiaca]|uniref:alpha/beta fold hydrolase n=1 Tax=Jiangella aurantiaca TaxID=2530373 RepID=UPI00193C98D4|nr:alpha/beta hydrolase [Jiangella aurantiaca]
MDRFDVVAADAVSLAVWVDGGGPPLVVVHGSIQDHTVSAPLVAELRADFTTFAMDRRGFGASGDGGEYVIERDFEDVAAVVDAVATRSGPVVLWGHSYGAGCAMGAAARTGNVSHLVLYEPGLGLTYPAGWIEAVERVVAAGDYENAVVMLFRDILGFSEEQIEARRGDPEWPGRVATAPTIAREARAEQEWVYRPGAFASVSAPTLLLSGSESPPEVKSATDAAAAAIRGARVHVLEGHAHIAHREHPAMVADLIRRFIAP